MTAGDRHDTDAIGTPCTIAGRLRLPGRGVLAVGFTWGCLGRPAYGRVGPARQTVRFAGWPLALLWLARAPLS